MMLEIKDDMVAEVMGALAARAKTYEKWIESGPGNTTEVVAEWQHKADEFWALVRQFSKT